MFRKIVSSLAYSPAMLWHLGKLDTKNKQELRTNNKIIVLAIFHLLLIGLIYIGWPNNNPALVQPNNPLPNNLSGRVLVETYNKIAPGDKIELGGGEISPGEPILLTFIITNNSNEDYTGVVSIHMPEVDSYVVPVSSDTSDVNIDWQKQQLHWNIKSLEPSESQTVQISLQSLNNFGTLLKNQSDRCSLDVFFGNKETLSFVCNPIKVAQIRISEINSATKIKILFYIGLLLLVILMAKLVHRSELKLSIKEIRLLRQKINRGKFLL